MRHGAVADRSTSGVDGRASAAAERPVDDAHERLTKLGVDGAVEEKVEREVDRLERVGDGYGQVVGVDVGRIADGHLAHEVHQLGRYDEREVHRHDHDQRQRDPIGRSAVTSAARPPSNATSGRLDAHAQRAAQLGDEVDVAEDEEYERRHDAEDEVRPL